MTWRFGRCPYFVITETETMAFDTLENPNVVWSSGAGIQSAPLPANRREQAVFTGN